MNYKYYKYLENKNMNKKQTEQKQLNNYEKSKNNNETQKLNTLLKNPAVIVYLLGCIIIVILIAFAIYKILFRS